MSEMPDAKLASITCDFASLVRNALYSPCRFKRYSRLHVTQHLVIVKHINMTHTLKLQEPRNTFRCLNRSALTSFFYLYLIRSFFQSLPAQSMMADQMLRRRYVRLRIAMDYGTSNASVAYQLVSPAPKGKTTGTQPKAVSFNSNTKELRQKVAYSSNDRQFYWGENLLKIEGSGGITENNIFKTWKLALYESHPNSEVVERIESQLEDLGITLDQLLADHIGAILTRAIEMIKRDFSSWVRECLHRE